MPHPLRACSSKDFGKFVSAMALLAMAAGVVLPPAAMAQNVLLQPNMPTSQEAKLDVNAWCADYRPGAQDGNVDRDAKRLRTVQADLAPGFDAGKRVDGLSLLAAYRQELERRRPDAASAAAYLALTSTQPITVAQVERVNALLCVSSSAKFAQAVAAAAEAQRQQLNR